MSGARLRVNDLHFPICSLGFSLYCYCPTRGVPRARFCHPVGLNKGASRWRSLFVDTNVFLRCLRPKDLSLEARIPGGLSICRQRRMADESHLSVLKQGVEAWNQWREQNPGVEPDLGEANLCGTIRTKANLGEADLYEANLSGENVNEVILTRANLSGANLRGAILTRANLSGANLQLDPWEAHQLGGEDNTIN